MDCQLRQETNKGKRGQIKLMPLFLTRKTNIIYPQIYIITRQVKDKKQMLTSTSLPPIVSSSNGEFSELFSLKLIFVFFSEEGIVSSSHLSSPSFEIFIVVSAINNTSISCCSTPANHSRRHLQSIRNRG